MIKAVITTSILTLCPIPLSAQSAKVVIEKETGMVSLYLGESGTQYHAEAQDDFWIPKSKAVLRTYSAANGQGVVFPNDFGTVNVRKRPDKRSKIVGKLVHEEGMYPDSAPCLGKVDGWYKVKLSNGEKGYVRCDLVNWSAISL